MHAGCAVRADRPAQGRGGAEAARCCAAQAGAGAEGVPQPAPGPGARQRAPQRPHPAARTAPGARLDAGRPAHRRPARLRQRRAPCTHPAPTQASSLSPPRFDGSRHLQERVQCRPGRWVLTPATSMFLGVKLMPVMSHHRDTQVQERLAPCASYAALSDTCAVPLTLPSLSWGFQHRGGLP